MPPDDLAVLIGSSLAILISSILSFWLGKKKKKS